MHQRCRVNQLHNGRTFDVIVSDLAEAASGQEQTGRTHLFTLETGKVFQQFIHEWFSGSELSMKKLPKGCDILGNELVQTRQCLRVPARDIGCPSSVEAHRTVPPTEGRSSMGWRGNLNALLTPR